jgi:hypothetical protein
MPLTDAARAQLIPMAAGPFQRIRLWLDTSTATQLVAKLYTTSRPDHHTPDVLLAEHRASLDCGQQQAVWIDFPITLAKPCCVFLVLEKNPAIAVRGSRGLVTGFVPLRHRQDVFSTGVGGEDFPIFGAQRRPGGQNFALRFDRALELWAPSNVASGWLRPLDQPHAWTAALDDDSPSITLTWREPVVLRRIVLFFDTDADHALETVLMTHPMRASPFCVKRYRLRTSDGRVIHVGSENHQTRNAIELAPPIETSQLIMDQIEMNGGVPATVRAVRCYG